MSREASQSLAELCRDEAGPYLRTVFHYENGGYETLYIRDDVADQYADEDFVEYFRLLADVEASEAAQTDALHVGNHHGTMRLYDDALVLHFPQGSNIGTMISFDPEAGRDVAAFVLQCLERLHEASDQEISHVPDWA